MPDSDGKVVRPSIRRRPGWLKWVLSWVLLLGALILAFFWNVVRVEIGPDQILVLVNKTGRPTPPDLGDEFSDQVLLYPALVEAISAKTGLAAEQVVDRYKGIRYDVVGAGRHWFNPYSYKRIVMPVTIIEQGEVGVQIRRYGKPLPFPKTVATQPDERGPVAETLTPARYNINLLAYDVQKFPAVRIPPGHVGVVTLLSGNDPVRKNTYTVAAGEKGVQADTLSPGLEYVNPYLKRIEIVDVRSHKYDMLGENAIHFPSNDSFTISIDGTIEWAIRPDRVAEVAVEYGDEEDILKKIILPYARSISRIQGSKLRAREFISGKTRTAFQDKLLAELKTKCWEQGIDIKAALVRDIQTPAEIAMPISERERADQEVERSTNEMEEARAEAKLVEQQELAEQNKAVGDAKRQVVTVLKEAEGRQVVAVTDANRALAVAEIELEAAEKEAAAIISRGTAEANVILFEYQAEAEPLARAVQAFGDGETYAQRFFLERIAPSIQSILSNTEGPFAEIFKQFQSFPDDTSEGGTR